MNSAVWILARAAVRRRRLQTVIVALVVLLSSAALTTGLGLINASRAPFDRAFAAASGAHLSAAFDPAKVTATDLAATAHTSGVTSAAGPFQTAVLNLGEPFPPALVVGRASLMGPVDRLTMTRGHWPGRTGEIVLRDGFSPVDMLGQTITLPGRRPLKVVGVARSVTQTADAWVLPQQMEALHPSGLQMLYRIHAGRTGGELAAISAGLPTGSVTDAESYQTSRDDFAHKYNEAIPFLVTFGVLALIVAVLIVANVVSGAVLAGFRAIGTMKSIGLTPRQVTAVYLLMVAIPAAPGCLAGVIAGDQTVAALSSTIGSDLGLPATRATSATTDIAVTLAIVSLVLLSALPPLLHAGRLSAIEAIRNRSGGGGRAVRIQRALARSPLPIPLSQGLCMPLARPGRTALTIAVICLGTATAVFGVGMYDTIGQISSSSITQQAQLVAHAPPNATAADEGPAITRLKTDRAVAAVVADDTLTVSTAGGVHNLQIDGYTGDIDAFMAKELRTGRPVRRPGEAVATGALLRAAGLRLGDTLPLTSGDRHTTVTIVGVAASPEPALQTSTATVQALTPPGTPVTTQYLIKLAPGTDPGAAAAALTDANLQVERATHGDFLLLFDGLFLAFTLFICAVAGLGVLYSLILTTREHTRELAILKTLGLTPRQIRRLVITATAALGLAAAVPAIPLGTLTHHYVMALTGTLIGSGMESRWIHIYTPPELAGLALSGVLLAILGALTPAIRTSRTPPAEALKSE